MKPAIGFLELSSIAKGIESVDVMMKKSEVEILYTQAIPRGKFVILIGGELAEVEQSMQSGVEFANEILIDHFIIPNVHEQVLPALRSEIKVEDIEAVGVIETKDAVDANVNQKLALTRLTMHLERLLPTG